MFVQILVQNIPEGIMVRDIEQTFSKFGKVKAITTSFYPDTTQTNAVVAYFNPEDANRAAQNVGRGACCRGEPCRHHALQEDRDDAG